jgi:hypothetical protein
MNQKVETSPEVKSFSSSQNQVESFSSKTRKWHDMVWKILVAYLQLGRENSPESILELWRTTKRVVVACV